MTDERRQQLLRQQVGDRKAPLQTTPVRCHRGRTHPAEPDLLFLRLRGDAGSHLSGPILELPHHQRAARRLQPGRGPAGPGHLRSLQLDGGTEGPVSQQHHSSGPLQPGDAEHHEQHVRAFDFPHGQQTVVGWTKQFGASVTNVANFPQLTGEAFGAQVRYDTRCFSINPTDYGNSVVNPIFRDGIVNLDFGMMERFSFWESRYLEFRADAFNPLTNVNLGGPSGSVTSGSFGRVSPAAMARQIQLVLRIVFWRVDSESVRSFAPGLPRPGAKDTGPTRPIGTGSNTSPRLS